MYGDLDSFTFGQREGNYDYWKPTSSDQAFRQYYTDKPKLPLVVYKQKTIYDKSEISDTEKKELNEKLIDPYFTYNRDRDIIAAIIGLASVYNGNKYSISFYFPEGGTHGMLFGDRSGNYDYWTPDCYGPCDFDEEFRQKYPQILEKLEWSEEKLEMWNNSFNGSGLNF